MAEPRGRNDRSVPEVPRCRVYSFKDETDTSMDTTTNQHGLETMLLLDGENKENESFNLEDTQFLSMIEKDPLASGKESPLPGKLELPNTGDPVVSFVLNVFADVCKKIDEIHRKMGGREKDECLDTVLMEDKDGGAKRDNRWLSFVRRVFWRENKEGVVESVERMSVSEKKDWISKDVKRLDTVVCEIRCLLRPIAEEFERVSSAVREYRVKMDQYKEKLRKKVGEVNAYKSKLHVKRRELALLKEAQMDGRQEEMVRDISAALVSILGRLSVLLDVPIEMERLQAPGGKGMQRCMETYSLIEQGVLSLVKTSSEAHSKGMLAKELEEQLEEERRERRKAEQEKKEMEEQSEKQKRDLERSKECINRQKLIVKLLKSRVPPKSTREEDPERERIVKELESTLASLKRKMETLSSEKERRVCAREKSDCERRLRDFLEL
jgi:hypothetical protein